MAQFELKNPLYRWLYGKLKNHRTFLHKFALTSGEGFNKEDFVLMDYQDENDLDCWCKIINASYSDASYSPEAAQRLLNHYPAVSRNRTVFYVQDGNRIATISFGRVRASEETGSFFRIAVLPDYQRQGIGRKLMRYAESELCEEGIQGIENIIRLKRTASLMMHFSLGYKPEKSGHERVWKPHTFRREVLSIMGYDFLIRKITQHIYKEVFLERE